MQKNIRLASLMLLVSISACTTTSSSFIKPYSTSDTTTRSEDYNREKAASSRLTLGLHYLTQGDYEKAKFNLDKAIAHYPESENVQRGLAWYYEQVNETELAKKYYQQALKINNKNPSLLNQYGVFLCRQGQIDESLIMFDASVKIITNKDVSGTYENAATCNLMAGNSELAKELYRKALNHNPEQKDSLLGMASMEYSKGRYERSRSYLKRFEKVSQHNSRSLWIAIKTASRLNDMNSVASYAIKLEQRFPDSQELELYLDTKNQWLK
ncbi:MAG: type IV pilus biogenesis/stability protein PilW [Gammaproteobacteria bacterium]|nr:type IV pilus biogenesis/stability protein PilW [Gammaproteobacteria bacterium]